jgi:hypothetical protein
MKLDIARDGTAVEVRFKTGIWAYPAGHGNTLAAALRQLADELEEFNCDLTPEQLDQSDEQIFAYMHENVEAVYRRSWEAREKRHDAA